MHMYVFVYVHTYGTPALIKHHRERLQHHCKPTLPSYHDSNDFHDLKISPNEASGLHLSAKGKIIVHLQPCFGFGRKRCVYIYNGSLELTRKKCKTLLFYNDANDLHDFLDISRWTSSINHRNHGNFAVILHFFLLKSKAWL